MSMIQPTFSLSIGQQPAGVSSAKQVLDALKQQATNLTQGIGSLEALLGGASTGSASLPFNTGITGGLGFPNSAVPAPTGLGSGFPTISAGFGLGGGAGLPTGGLFGAGSPFGPSLGGSLGLGSLGGLGGGLSPFGGLGLSDPTQQTQGNSKDLLSSLVPLLLTLLTLLKDKQGATSTNSGTPASNGSGININNTNTNNNSANAGSSVAPAPVPPRPPVSGAYGAPAPAASAGSVSQAASQGTQNTSIAGSTIKKSSVFSGNDVKQSKSQLFANAGSAVGVNNNTGVVAATNKGPALALGAKADGQPALDLTKLIEGLLKEKQV